MLLLLHIVYIEAFRVLISSYLAMDNRFAGINQSRQISSLTFIHLTLIYNAADDLH